MDYRVNFTHPNSTEDMRNIMALPRYLTFSVQRSVAPQKRSGKSLIDDLLRMADYNGISASVLLFKILLIAVCRINRGVVRFPFFFPLTVVRRGMKQPIQYVMPIL